MATVDNLTRQRRRVIVMAQRVSTALADNRREPPWEWRSVTKQLVDLFGPPDEADADQLRMADWFLTAWLDVLPLADGAFWSDPVGDD